METLRKVTFCPYCGHEISDRFFVVGMHITCPYCRRPCELVERDKTEDDPY
ncbi:MAG: hypothetical protein ACOC32_00350 [Nanoarchaeota archaeon]